MSSPVTAQRSQQQPRVKKSLLLWQVIPVGGLTGSLNIRKELGEWENWFAVL